MPTSPHEAIQDAQSDSSTHAAILATLYIEALRQGQPLWFRVASGSMTPLLRVNDTVYIEPAQLQSISIGEIAAFETPDGLVIHRIVHRQQTGETIRLLQMGDGEVRPSWIEPDALLGRVITVRRGSISVDIRYPIARWYGKTTAVLRYQLYLQRSSKPLSIVLRICSSLICRVGSWYVHHFCIA